MDTIIGKLRDIEEQSILENRTIIDISLDFPDLCLADKKLMRSIPMYGLKTKKLLRQSPDDLLILKDRID